jgi:hypothetical protein
MCFNKRIVFEVLQESTGETQYFLFQSKRLFDKTWYHWSGSSPCHSTEDRQANWILINSLEILENLEDVIRFKADTIQQKTS